MSALLSFCMKLADAPFSLDEIALALELANASEQRGKFSYSNYSVICKLFTDGSAAERNSTSLNNPMWTCSRKLYSNYKRKF
jgi:hypothetical protein